MHVISKKHSPVNKERFQNTTTSGLRQPSTAARRWGNTGKAHCKAGALALLVVGALLSSSY